jgi:hypothetical protein
MQIRTYQAGDEEAQVAIYNEAAGPLPKFKAATVAEIRRRCQAADFDPGTRFFAEDGGRVLGYAGFHTNGRVSFPWCRPGAEHLAEPLFERVVHAMRQRGQRLAFAAYRGDWPQQQAFFLNHGFHLAREMLNFVMDLIEMPTPAAPPKNAVTSLRPEDIPALLAMEPRAFRATSADELQRHFFHNPYFGPEAVFVNRGQEEKTPAAVGVLIANPAYADPKQVDAAMPCFRLGAFGSEGMQTKRINGLFSFVTRADSHVVPQALDLLSHAAVRLEKTPTATLAAQVPSDVPHLVNFYARFFRKQGSFPVLERAL